MLVAHVDDEQFRRGRINSGPEQSTRPATKCRPGDGPTDLSATLRLPARTDTRLAVGVPRIIVRRKIEGREGKEGLRRRIQRLDSSVVAPHGRLLRLSGFLATADRATDRRRDHRGDWNSGRRGTVTSVGVATTGTDGKFHYTVKAARNREFCSGMAGRDGSDRRHGLHMLVPASTSIHPDRRLCNGQQVLFSGNVTTRPLPIGKLVEMQAHFRGRWRTFSTVRADPNGRWRFPYRFGGTAGRVTYRFRARLPAVGWLPIHQWQLPRRQGVGNRALTQTAWSNLFPRDDGGHALNEVPEPC